MRYFLKILVLSVLLMSAPFAARADVADGTRIDPRVIAPLMAWVEQQTGIHVKALPEVIASRTQFRAIVARTNVQGRARAVYTGGRVLVDNEAWDAEDNVQLSLIVHELVHYAQAHLPRDTWACGDAREAQAYTLQNQWLEEHDENPFVNAAWIRRVSSCSAQTSVALAQSNW